MEEEFELEQTDQIIPQQKHRSRVWKFLKPNIRKIIFFLILAFPWIVNLFGQFLLTNIIPIRFSLLNMYIWSVSGLSNILLMPLAVLLCGGFHGICKENLIVGILVYFLIYLILFFIIWFLACFLGWLWARLFGLFKTKAKLVEIVVALAFFVVFISVFLIWPLLTTKTGVIMERDTREDFLMPEGEFAEIFNLQQIILKNQSIMPVFYTLPPVTVCMYDRDQKESKFVVAGYDDLAGNDMHGMVRLGSLEEKKIFLAVINTIINYDSGGYYDQFLIFYDVGTNNKSFCEDLSEQDIVQAEKVEIIPQPLSEEKLSEPPTPAIPEKVRVEGIERCEEITSENRRYNFPREERNDCLRELSFETLDASVCDYFDVDPSWEVCKTIIAAKKADQAICDQIVSKENKARCQTAVEASQKGAEVCEQISDWEDLLERSYCFFYLAEATLEPNFCENIEVDELGFNQTQCYRDIAFVKQDISICDRIKDHYPSSRCKLRIILQIQDASLCEELPSVYREDCYTGLENY